MQVSPLSSHLQSTHAVPPQNVHDKAIFAKLLSAANVDNSGSDAASDSSIVPQSLNNSLATDLSSEHSSEVVSDDLKKAFSDFVGQTFFSELIKSYRSSQQEAAYFNGGRAEKIFQGQLDQIFAEELSESSADKVAGPMFEQFKRM